MHARLAPLKPRSEDRIETSARYVTHPDFAGRRIISPLGYQAFLPDLLGGWGWTYALCFTLLAVWYLLIRYNESTERFTVL